MTLFEHVNYAGASLEITSDTPDLRSKGAQWNDQASSVKVPAGTTVTLFEHINYGGRSLALTSDAPDLRSFPGPGKDGTWNDAASSVKVSGSGPTDPGPGDGGGKSERLKTGGKYVECNAGGTISLNATKTDASKVTITKHDDKKYDVAFTSAGNKAFSVQNDGSLQSRPQGQYGAFEALNAITAPDPDSVNLIYRTDGGKVVGPIFQIVEE